MCGGTKTTRWIPEHFRMLYSEPAQLAHTVEEDEDPLEARELTLGQCVSGNVGFILSPVIRRNSLWIIVREISTV